jgi:hypothetical protein
MKAVAVAGQQDHLGTCFEGLVADGARLASSTWGAARLGATLTGCGALPTACLMPTKCAGLSTLRHVPTTSSLPCTYLSS